MTAETAPEAGMRLVPEKWLEVARYATEPGLNAHEANVRRIEFDRIVSPLAVLSLAAAPVPPAGGEGEEPDWLKTRDPFFIEGWRAARAQPPVGGVVAWVDGRVLEQLGKTHACATTNIWKSQPTITHVPLYAHPTEPAARDMGELEERLPAICARVICEREGREWAGLDNSREDCERWFDQGHSLSDAIMAALAAGGEK